eukprot:361622-Chlamydomonas_euryale.AAC.6
MQSGKEIRWRGCWGGGEGKVRGGVLVEGKCSFTAATLLLTTLDVIGAQANPGCWLQRKCMPCSAWPHAAASWCRAAWPHAAAPWCRAAWPHAAAPWCRAAWPHAAAPWCRAAWPHAAAPWCRAA